MDREPVSGALPAIPVRPFVAVMGLVGVSLAGILATVAWRRRDEPAAAPFTLLMVAVGWWIATDVPLVLSRTPAVTAFLVDIQWVGLASIPVLWFWFTLRYTGRSLDSRVFALAWVVPVVTTLATFAAPTVTWVRASYAVSYAGPLTVVEVTHGPLFWMFTLYGYVLTVGGAVVLGGFLLESRSIYRRQAAALVVAVAVPLVANVVSLTVEIPYQLNLTPFAFLVTGVAAYGAVSRFDFLETLPVSSSVARDIVVDSMDDAVFVVDATDRIVDYNPRAQALLTDAEDPRGFDAADVFPDYGRLRDREGAVSETIQLTVEGRERLFDVRLTPLGGENRDGGRVVALRDVTEQQRRRQQLDVLHRVLRHNIRNDMTVVYGHAENLEAQQADPSRGTDGGVDSVQAIKERSEEIVAMAEKARTLERMLDREERAPVPEPIVALVESVAAGVRAEHPNVTVGVTARASETVCADAQLRTVVENLVENAAEHNTAVDPWVWVDVEGGDGRPVRIRVADNGPAIPEEERSVLAMGGETQLEHGSGLGLWLVKWGCRTVGGTVDFAERESGGNLVTVRAPALHGGDAA